MADDAPDPTVLTAAEAPPKRFAWNLHELSGSLGDLGTFLPHIIGAVTVVGMDPTGIFVSFGLFYAVAGGFYGVPMAVQPMKAASAAILIQPMDPGSVAAAGMVIGAFFLLVAATGLIERLARVIPETVAAGLQLGLGLSLAVLGVQLIGKDAVMGVAMGLAMLAMMQVPRLPVALIAVLAGAVIGQVTGLTAPLPKLHPGLYLPHPIWPTWAQVLNGTARAVVPQIPLTLTNAIIVTAAVARQLFPGGAARVTERNLALTTGLGNLIAAPFGGYMMCHGAGGISGHYRFGARTATASVLIGLIFLALGLFLGPGGYQLLRTIPQGVLGTLLFFSGLDLALSCRPGRFKDAELFLVLGMAAIAVAVNPAVAFVLGVPLAHAVRRGWSPAVR